MEFTHQRTYQDSAVKWDIGTIENVAAEETKADLLDLHATLFNALAGGRRLFWLDKLLVVRGSKSAGIQLMVDASKFRFLNSACLNPGVK